MGSTNSKSRSHTSKKTNPVINKDKNNNPSNIKEEQKYQEDVAKTIKILAAGGDTEIGDRIMDSFKTNEDGKIFLDRVLNIKDKAEVTTTVVETGFDILERVSDIFEATKPVTDALQVVGIAFGIISTVLNVIKGYKEVDDAVADLHDELMESAKLLEGLKEAHQTSRKEIDKDSKSSFNNTSKAVLKCYLFILKYGEEHSLKKILTQSQNKKEIEELKEGLRKAKENLHSYLLRYQILTTVTNVMLIADLEAREIWRNTDAYVAEQPTQKLINAIKKYAEGKNIQWDSNLEERIKKDLDLDGNGYIHYTELNSFTSRNGGLEKQLKYYVENPNYCYATRKSETDKLFTEHFLLFPKISDQKKENSNLFEPETRKPLFDAIIKWLDSGDKNIFLIKAPAGMGKSVISYQLVTRNDNSCLGYFFFEFSDKERRSPRNAFTTLLRHIAEKFKEVKDFLLEEIKKEEIRNSIKSLSGLLKGIFLPALRKIPNTSKGYFILLDALDEMEIDKDQRTTIGDFFKELNNNSNSPIKLIVTTRPEIDIMEMFGKKKDPLPVEHFQDFEKMNQDDIRIYAKKLVQTFSPKFQEKEKEGEEIEFENLLVERSQYVFLWMRLAKDWMEDKNDKDQLVSFKMVKEQLPNGLDDTYTDFFKRLLEKRNQNERETIFNIIKIISFTFEPLNSIQIAWLLRVTDSNDDVKLLRFQSLLESLQSLFPANSKGCYSAIHKSVSDYIEKNREDLTLTYEVSGFLREEIHQKIAERICEQFQPQEGPSFDLCKLQDLLFSLCETKPLSKGEEEIVWIEKWNEYIPSKILQFSSNSSEMIYSCFNYAMEHFFQHLQLAGKSKADKSIWDIILEFFYVKYCMNMIKAVPLQDLQAIKEKLKKDTISFFRQYHHVFTETPLVIFQYACTYAQLRELGLSWANKFNKTHNDKVVWLNLPLLKESRCIQTLTGHNDSVNCCAISPDGKWIASGSNDKTLILWNTTTGELLHTLTGHASIVNCCVISPDAKWIVSGSNDNMLKLWNATTGELLHTLSGHNNYVFCCAISPDGKWIVSGSGDKTIKLWNATTGELLHTLSGHSNNVNCCAISPDGKQIVSGSVDKTLILWNATTGELLHTLNRHTNSVNCCAISPDGKWIVSGSDDKTLKIWNLTTGELLHTLRGHTYSVSCCAISPDGKWIVSGSNDNTLKLWNATTGELLHTLTGHTFYVTCCAISPDGKWIVSGSRIQLKIWNSTAGELLQTLTGHIDSVNCCAISSDGKQIVSGSNDNTLILWNTTTGELLQTLTGHTFYVNCCAISPDGKWIVSGSNDNTIKLWNATTGELLHTLSGHTRSLNCCAISPDGKQILSGSVDNTLKLWNATTGKLLHTLTGHNDSVNCCAISPDGKWIVSGSWDKTIKLWNTTTGELLQTLTGHSSYVNCCAISPDGKWIVSGSADKTIKLWNTTIGQQMHNLECKDYISKITVEDGLCFASSSTTIYRINLAENRIDNKYYFLGIEGFDYKSNNFFFFYESEGIHFPVIFNCKELEDVNNRK